MTYEKQEQLFKMLLKPSEIFYSQHHISTTFGKSTDHRFQDIGSALDDLINGKLSVTSFPQIKVTKRPGENKWYTISNRRLWIFHHYEAYLRGRGETLKIEVDVVEYCFSFIRYFNSTNGGTSVTYFRNRNPGGIYWQIITPVVPKYVEPEQQEQHLDALTRACASLAL